MKLALVLPVRNPGAWLDALLPALASQTLQPDTWLVVDSESSDGSIPRFEAAGACVISIAAKDFNHGGTRRMASEQVQADVLIYLTQDAIPVTPDCFARLCAPFQEDETVGMVYGRQLPHLDAGLLGAHARRFNYPEESRTKRLTDAANLGIKTCFASDSFCAYRQKALQAVGGYPKDTIGTEDVYVAGRMLLAGWGVRYESQATVRHSHDYNFMQEFRRYFDIGVFYGRERWIAQNFGTASGEGLRFVRSELSTLWQAGQWWRFPEVCFRSGLKWLGYQLGYREKHLPLALKRRLSMHKAYWSQEAML